VDTHLMAILEDSLGNLAPERLN